MTTAKTIAGCLFLVLGSAACGSELCNPGHEGCPCFANSTCLNDLSCSVAGRCETSADETQEPDDPVIPDPVCTLDSDCDAIAEHAGHVCLLGQCEPCIADSDCVGSAHYASTLCEDGRCTVISTCLTEGCVDGEVCDEMSGLCRDPIDCEEAGCVSFQLCQEAAASADAECLAECEAGHAWNQVDGSCAAIPPNCHEDWDNNIVATCVAESRLCVETDDDAFCGDCYPGFRDDDGACVEVVTCSSLSCATEQRLCVPAGDHTDAHCGDCLGGFTERFGVCEGIVGATCASVGADSILADCAARYRECVPDASGAACGACIAGTVANPATGQCVTQVTCAELDCAAEHRDCSVTWNAECTDCETQYREDAATGECVCAEGTLPGLSGECEPIITCTDIGASCTSIDEQCIEATATNHATCRKCFEDEAWYDHWLTCLACPPCTNTGETGRVYPITSQAGHCVCETQEGYFHSESGLGGTFACDKDGDGWVTAAARLPLESAPGTAERDNARCDLRQIDRFLLINEAGETQEVLLSEFDFLSGAVPLYEPENRDRADRMANDYDYTNPNMANYAPALGGGRYLTPAELNPMTKACPTAVDDPNARYADFNANGVVDIDELGMQDERGDPEGRLFSMFSYQMELHRGFFEQPEGELFGRWVIRERDRSTFALPGWNVALHHPPGSDYWRGCRRFRDADFTADGPPYGMDFATWDANADCDTGGPDSFCGMNHHSQFKCLLAVDSAEVNSDLPHHQVASNIRQSYETTSCQPSDTLDPVTPGAINPNAPAWSCAESNVPDSGHAVWGISKYQDYGDTKAPNPSYVRGCMNECAEKALLPPERQCQGPPGPPPILCNGLESDHGRLFCYREIDWVTISVDDQSYYEGSPDGVACPPWDAGCSDPAATAEPGRDPANEALGFTPMDWRAYSFHALEVMTTEVTQDQFRDFFGHDPSRFDCAGSICPVEQVTWYDAIAMANLMSDRLGYDRCYDFQTMRCVDGTHEELWSYEGGEYTYVGQYCRDHGGIDEILDMESEFGFTDRTYDPTYPGLPQSWQCEGYRLPTDIEWEFLARAGTQTAYYAGANDAAALDCEYDATLDAIGWYCGNTDERTGPVGVKAPNPFGLYDMAGNVWEWVVDLPHVQPWSATGEFVDMSVHSPGRRMARGGAWNRGARDARHARRVDFLEDTRNYGVGFRLVRSQLSFDRYAVIYPDTPNTWQEAEDFCQAEYAGGHLVSMENKSTRWRLWRLLKDELTDTTRFWVGYNDIASEGNFVWSDGEVDAPNDIWIPGQPNGGDCVYMALTDTGDAESFNDIDCADAATVDGYICEIPQVQP